VNACTTLNCPITVRAAPAPTTTGTLAFSNIDNGTANYYIGTTPAYNETIVVSNNAEAKCDEVKYRLVRGTDTTANATLITGALTAADVGTIQAQAYATCRGTPLTVLKTAAATVVPNPTLTGTCVWDTKNNTWGGGVNAKITTTPTINDRYGRTCDGPYFAVGGVKKEAVGTGLKVDTWNGTSTQTMTGITISATCGDLTLTPAITCQNITVKDPDAMCEYTPSMCNDVDISQVITAAQNVNNSSTGVGKCYYATTITDIRIGATTKINGTEIGTCNNEDEWGLPTCTSVLSGIEKIDGGYYIAGYDWIISLVTSNSYDGLHPNCR
jgi:hypothetical protein